MLPLRRVFTVDEKKIILALRLGSEVLKGYLAWQQCLDISSIVVQMLIIFFYL